MSFKPFLITPHPEDIESQYALYEFNITEAQIDNFILKAIENQQHIGRNNLRERNPLIQIDNFVRGYIGEYAMGEVIKTDPNIIVHDTNLKTQGSSIDFDFSLSIQGEHRVLEVKTSGINQRQNTITTMVMGDPLKKIQSGRVIIFDRYQGDLNKIEDLHAQFIFNTIIPERDEYLNREYQRYLNEIFPKQYQHYLSQNPNAKKLSDEEQKQTAEQVLSPTIERNLSEPQQEQKNQKIFNIIKNHLQIDYQPLQTIFFTGWATKEYIIHNMTNKRQNQQSTHWNWGDRTFWDLRISESFAPEDFNGQNILKAIPTKPLEDSNTHIAKTNPTV